MGSSLHSSVTRSKIGQFHLNDLKCFKSPTCSVVLFVASKSEVGEMNEWFFEEVDGKLDVGFLIVCVRRIL